MATSITGSTVEAEGAPLVAPPWIVPGELWELIERLLPRCGRRLPAGPQAHVGPPGAVHHPPRATQRHRLAAPADRAGLRLGHHLLPRLGEWRRASVRPARSASRVLLLMQATCWPSSDEKILGTIHVSAGDTWLLGGVNESSLRWDLLVLRSMVTVGGGALPTDGRPAL